MTVRSIPRGVVMLGFVSLFMDVSSEMIHSLLPVFLVSVLGASALSVGIIEGVAESVASVSRIFSGVLSDWIGRRKPLVLAGYGLAALAKPLFPLAGNVPTVLLARFIDRICKGIRGAPRDALIADLVPQSLRGGAYGLRQSMDTVGAFAGPVLAMILMVHSGDDYRFVFWIAVIPAFIAVAFIVFGVREPEPPPGRGRQPFPLQPSEIRKLGTLFWIVVAFATVLTLARFSEAFLLLRAAGVGLAEAYVPAILIVMNVVYAVSAYPVGKWSDRIGRRWLLATGITVLIGADIVLALASDVGAVVIGAALWGLHMGATQGLLSAVVADRAPDRLRGTAFGMFNLVTGLALLAASAIAGALWTLWGPSETFLAGAGFAAIAVAGLLVPRSWWRRLGT